MPLNLAEARDSMLGHIKTDWDANTTAVAGYIPDVIYDNLEPTEERNNALYYARVTIQHFDGEQKTLAKEGNRRFEHIGQVFFQLYAPSGEGRAGVDGLAQVAKTSFQKGCTLAGVRFTRVRIEEIGADGPFFQVDVVADFEYHEVE